MPGRLFLNSILGLFLNSILVFKGVIYHLVKYLRVDIEIKNGVEWNGMGSLGACGLAEFIKT